MTIDKEQESLPLSINSWLCQARQRLQPLLANAEQEARWLLQAMLKIDSTGLFLNANKPLSLSERLMLDACLDRRVQGEPLAYILGQWSFYGLEMKVSAETLIPRADTEFLVDKILEFFSPQLPFRALDLGTGSGAIALAIASQRPLAKVYAIDRSWSALKIAQENARALSLPTIQFLASNWCSALIAQPFFNVIVSNPPYLSLDDPHLKGSIRYEPEQALVSGETGLEDFKQLVSQSFSRLYPGGLLCFEHGYQQGSDVRLLMIERGYEKVQTLCDLNGHERVSLALKPTN